MGDDWSDVVEHEDTSRAPRFVRIVPRLKNDIETLMQFTCQECPPEVGIRPTGSAAAYLVGDASGSGFGTSLWVDGTEVIDTFHGAWTEEVSSKSSNFREAYNLVLRVEQLVKDGSLLKGSELFIFTDNSTSERAFYNGSSKAKELHALVTKLRSLEMKGQLFTHVIWIAGTRMIAQGTDGLSRGDLNTGVMAGENFLNYVPLNKGVASRSPDFIPWFKDLLPATDTWNVLDDPQDWFEEAYQEVEGRYIWMPPPALADVAAEQLCDVFHVHPTTSHVLICPSLFTARWRKQLFKAADVSFSISLGSPHWSAEEHEPLTCVFVCPLLNRAPWSVRKLEWVEHWKETMRGLSWDRERTGGSHVCKFWAQAWRHRERAL